MASIGFSGGAKLEAALRRIADASSDPGVLRVGFLEGSTEADGTSIPMVASIQEYGAPAAGIPSRPFFRQMIAEKSPKWGEQMGAVAKANHFDGAVTLNAMGEGIKGQLQDSIRRLTTPALKPETAKRKGFDKPLIHTGAMLNSVDYDIEK